MIAEAQFLLVNDLLEGGGYQAFLRGKSYSFELPGHRGRGLCKQKTKWRPCSLYSFLFIFYCFTCCSCGADCLGRNSDYDFLGQGSQSVCAFFLSFIVYDLLEGFTRSVWCEKV